MTGNAEQIAFWNAEAGEKWAALSDTLDAMIAPFGDAAMDAASVKTGERVVDVGCGCGATVMALAARVGAGGAVLGVDVSEPMLAVARDRARGLAQVRFLNADVAEADLGEGVHDVLFSRFGVMFFADPVAGFRTLARSLVAGGRVAFVCWRPLVENAWARVPLEAIAPLAGTLPKPEPGAPGPFAFGDATRVRGILESAGLRDVHVDAFDHAVRIGATDDLDAAVEHAMEIGPASRLLRELPDPTVRPTARAAIHKALAFHHRPDGVRLGGATWVVTARR